jgi:phosphate:Na+ symporter
LATQGLLPLEAALAMVLGANLGGSVVAFVLTLKANSAVRRVVWCNLFLRGGGAAAVLALLVKFDAATGLQRADAGQLSLYLHLLFNLALLLISLPFVGPLMRVATTLVREPAQNPSPGEWRSALDTSVLNQPVRAFGCAQRELVEMGHRCEIMLRDALRLFETYDETTAKGYRAEFQNVSRMSLDIRTYLSRVRSKDDVTGNRAFDLSTIAVNLEAGADVVARKMVELARSKDIEDLQFSADGWRELTDFHDVVLRNAQHAISVLMSEDVGLARELVEQKERVRDLEQRLQRAHLQRLREGLTETFETSAIHLDLLRSLKMLNTSFAMVAYPLLEERGELLESRLATS